MKIDHEENMALNFVSIIDKMDAILEKWSHHQLTLMGRVLIVNTLCESLFVYKMNVLRDLPMSMIEDIESRIYKFIWKGKKARIAKATLKTAKKHGGLRLFDPKNKQKALKLTWVKVVQQTPFFEFCFWENMKITKFPNIFECNVHSKDVVKICDTSNFWGQILMHWCEFTYHEPNDINSILHESIWYNSHIKQNGALIFNTECYEKGVRFIMDIHDDQEVDGLLSYANFQTKYKCKLTWLGYEGIKKSIPELWKFLLAAPPMYDPMQFVSSMDRILQQPKILKYVYNVLIDNNQCVHKYSNRWHQTEHLCFNEDRYHESFSHNYKTTSIVKL